MKKIKIIISISLFAAILTACGTVKDGFKNQKKDSRDEFLVEKKAPLVMPPNFNELPVPNDINTSKNDNSTEVKKLITKSKNNNSNSSNSISSNGSLENKILEKIQSN